MRFQSGKKGACLEIQNSAAEIKLRAERRAGELLEKMELHDGNPRSHDGTRLSDIGITKNQSSRWQKIAAIPQPVFEDFIEETKAAEKELTTAGVLQKWTASVLRYNVWLSHPCHVTVKH